MNKFIIIGLFCTFGCGSTNQYSYQIDQIQRMQQEQDKQIAELEVRAKLLVQECKAK